MDHEQNTAGTSYIVLHEMNGNEKEINTKKINKF